MGSAVRRRAKEVCTVSIHALGWISLCGSYSRQQQQLGVFSEKPDLDLAPDDRRGQGLSHEYDLSHICIHTVILTQCSEALELFLAGYQVLLPDSGAVRTEAAKSLLVLGCQTI
jgi:hypothetical protein